MAKNDNKPKKLPRIRHKKLIILFTAILIAATVFAVKAFSSKHYVLAEEGDSFEIPRPASGSPSEYSAKDNLGIAIWTINHGKNFKTNTVGTVTAKVAMINYKQEINNTRIVTNDGMYLETISDSSLVHVYEEKYFQDGQVVIRDKKKNYTTVTNETFLESYGWLPSEFGAYILNDDTILECSMVQEGSLYNISIKLDPVLSAPKKQRETKTIGGAKGYPGYKKCELLLTLNESWQPVELKTTEVYDIGMPGIGDITCSGLMTETFEYGDFEIPDKQAFKEHVGEVSGSLGEKEKGAIDYLQEVFGPLISGKMNDFKININALDNSYDGYVNIDMAEGINVNAYIEDIFVNYAGNDVYIKLGDNKYKLSIDNVKKYLSDSSSTSSNALDMNSLTEQINNTEIIKNGNNLTLVIKLDLMGINVKANINAVLNSEELYELVDVAGEITIANEKIKLSLAPSTKYSYPKIDSSYKSIDDAFGIINTVKKLMNKNLSITAKAKVEDISVAVEAIYENGSVSGLIKVNDKYDINVIYSNDVIYLSFKNINVKASINDIISLVNELNISTPDIDLDINMILDIIKSLSIKASGTKIDLAVDLSKIVEEIGKLELSIDYSDGIKLVTNKYGIEATVKATNNNASKVDSSIEYEDLNDLKWIIKDILDVMEYDAYNIDINASYDQIKVTGNAYIDKDLNVKATINVDYSGLTFDGIELYYIDKVIYFSYGELNIKVGVDEIDELIDDVVKTFGLDDFEMPKLELDIDSILNGLFLDIDTDSITIKANLESITDLLKNVTLKINNDLTVDVNNNDNIKANIKLTKALKKELVIPSIEYLDKEDIKLIIEYAKELKDVVENWRYHIAFDLHVNGYGIYANVNIVTLNPGLSLYGKLIIVENEGTENEKIYYAVASILENRAYLDFSQTVTNFNKDNPIESTTTKSIKFEIGFAELIETINIAIDKLGIENDTIDTAINYLVKMIDTNGDLEGFMKDIKGDVNIDLSMVTSFIDLKNLGIKVDENSLKITFGLNSNNELQVLELTRDNGAIKGLNVSNLIINNDELDANFELLEDADIVNPKSVNPSGWLNFDGISTLVKALLNNYNDGQIEMDGDISGSAIGIDLTDIKVKAKIDLTDLKNIKAYIEVNLNKFIGVINDNTTTKMYINNGNIYISRYTYSNGLFGLGAWNKTETRKMSLDDFGTDILEQMIWCFNFSDSIANSIRNSESVTPTIEEVLTDYSKTGNTYNVTLAGDKLVGTSVFGNINASIAVSNSVADDDETVSLNKISIKTSIASILSLKADLNVKATNVDFNMNEMLSSDALEAFTAYTITKE